MAPHTTSILQIDREICLIYQSGLFAACFIHSEAATLHLPAGTGPSHRHSTRGFTFVFVEQLVGVLDDFIMLPQLQHALAVIQFQGDDHSSQINVVYVARHLLHTRAQMGEEGGEGVISCCGCLTSAACISIIRGSSGGLNVFTQKHDVSSGTHYSRPRLTKHYVMFACR